MSFDFEQFKILIKCIPEVADGNFPHRSATSMHLAEFCKSHIDEIDELVKDQQRLDYVLPLISGDDSRDADARTIAIGTAIVKGLSGRNVIDFARENWNNKHAD